MAMLITKFHRLIQNKLLWITFLVVVVFSFVIWGTQMPETGTGGPNAAGTLDGEDISFEEFQRSRFNTYLALVLMSGRAVTITPEMDEQLYTMAWQRLAALREAERLGISSSDEEVVRSIQSFEFLQQGGRFSEQAYEQFAAQFLAPMRASKRDFEEHVRQEIVLQKLRVMMERMLLVSPTEIQRTYATLTDTFHLSYARLTPDLVQDVVVSEEDIQAFYSKDPEQFTLAEKMVVKAAQFPASDFAADAVISDAEIEEYYDFNIERYALPRAEEDNATNDLFSTAPTEYRPLDEVRDEIRASLATMQGLLLAEQQANEFVQQVSNRRDEGQGVFDQVAADLGVELIKLSPFTIRQVPAEVDPEAAVPVVRAAFNLTDDPDYYFSDPVKGSNTVYVLALVERLPERVPSFEEVREDVTALATEFAAYNALTEKAQEVREAAIAALSAGLTFGDALAAYNLTSDLATPFTINSGDVDETLSPDLIRAALVLNEGEVTDLIPDETGILIGQVTRREVASDMAMDSMRPQIIGTMRRQAGQVSFLDFQNYLLQRGEFTDYMRRERSENTPADGEDDV
jgi:parvulin-like peptidyl-prolyl isomerase